MVVVVVVLLFPPRPSEPRSALAQSAATSARVAPSSHRSETSDRRRYGRVDHKVKARLQWCTSLKVEITHRITWCPHTRGYRVQQGMPMY
jgi:hypothetical protein